MTAKIDLLRQAIAYLREHPDEYDQMDFCYRDSSSGLLVTCVIGRAALMEGAIVGEGGYIEEYPGEAYDSYEFVVDRLGFDEDDYDYIYDINRTLNEIEARVNEIDARENPPVEVEIVNVKVNGVTYNVPANHLDWFIVGARAAGDPRIFKVTEEEL